MVRHSLVCYTSANLFVLVLSAEWGMILTRSHWTTARSGTKSAGVLGVCWGEKTRESSVYWGSFGDGATKPEQMAWEEAEREVRGKRRELRIKFWVSLHERKLNYRQTLIWHSGQEELDEAERFMGDISDTNGVSGLPDWSIWTRYIFPDTKINAFTLFS